MSVPWDANPERVGKPCVAGGGYADINGAQVVVTDPAGKTIATSQLPSSGILRDANGFMCEFAFSVDVPGGHDFYGIEVSHRGRLQYSEGQLKSGDLALVLNR